MHRLRRYGVALLATSGLVTIVLLATGWGSAVAADVKAVVVANTAANPVPVQQQGTATVAGSVAIDPAGNGVQVTNPPTSPVPVAAAADSHPYVVSDTASMLDGALAQQADVALPAGKRFVIEAVSVGGAVPTGSGQTLEGLVGPASAGGGTFAVPLQPVGTRGGFDYGVGDQLTRLYADGTGGASDLQLVCVRYGSATGPATCRFFLSGYLVDR